MQKMMTTNEVAERARISLVTLRRYMKSGDCPRHVKLPGGEYRFDPAAVEEWLARLTVEPNAQDDAA